MSFDIGTFCLDALIPMLLPLLEAPLILCFRDLEKFLHYIKFGRFLIFRSFTFQGVLNVEKCYGVIQGQSDIRLLSSYMFWSYTWIIVKSAYCVVHYLIIQIF